MLAHWKWWKRKDWGRPWIGAGEGFKLSEDLIKDLHFRGVFSIWDAQLPEQDGVGRSKWKEVDFLGLTGNKKEEWNSFIGLLYSNFILLQEEDEDIFVGEKT
jgi:hypothetical protein